VFLDLSDQISCCGEQGLLSIAFTPDYAKSGLLYASFTDSDGDSRVVEFERSENGQAADPGTAREIFSQDQPFSNHNGGLVLFGPDGHLYLGLGDGGSAGDPDRNGQDPDTYLGKLLRFGDLDGSPPEIFALGLRNPWRYSFDPKTDDLWIGDVGQQSLEEIDGVTFADAEGANFGWSAYEGTERYNDDQEAPGAVPPVLTYGHDEGCSVTGGYVVRDPDLTSLYGRYLYGDYCAGELLSFPARPGKPASDDRELGEQVPGLSSFGEDAEGHVYAVSVEGPVYRLEPPAAE
jgi:glucose/arabinose dehydrogenase